MNEPATRVGLVTEYEIQGCDSTGHWMRMMRTTDPEHAARSITTIRKNPFDWGAKPPYRIIKREITGTVTDPEPETSVKYYFYLAAGGVSGTGHDDKTATTTSLAAAFAAFAEAVRDEHEYACLELLRDKQVKGEGTS